MRAYARRTNKPVKRVSKRKFNRQRTAPPPPPPPSPPSNPDLHYEAAWTVRDIRQLDRCYHKHATLIEAVKCAMPTGAGWYVFAVEKGKARELLDAEDEIVNGYRFGTRSLT